MLRTVRLVVPCSRGARCLGTVPSAARFAIIGMRVNSECLCGGLNDLMVGNLRYAESAGGTVVQKYNLAEEAKRRIGQVC